MRVSSLVGLKWRPPIGELDHHLRKTLFVCTCAEAAATFFTYRRWARFSRCNNRVEMYSKDNTTPLFLRVGSQTAASPMMYPPQDRTARSYSLPIDVPICNWTIFYRASLIRAWERRSCVCQSGARLWSPRVVGKPKITE